MAMLNKDLISSICGGFSFDLSVNTEPLHGYKSREMTFPETRNTGNSWQVAYRTGNSDSLASGIELSRRIPANTGENLCLRKDVGEGPWQVNYPSQKPLSFAAQEHWAKGRPAAECSANKEL